MKYPHPSTSASAGTVLAALALLSAASDSQAEPGGSHRNLTAGGPLRHGVYGRIEVRGPAPPVIYRRPTIATQVTVPLRVQPVYLYVPPGQVRHWKQHCAKWSACNEPVLFVRMDDSPGRWGRWRHARNQLAWQGGAPE